MILLVNVRVRKQNCLYNLAVLPDASTLNDVVLSVEAGSIPLITYLECYRSSYQIYLSSFGYILDEQVSHMRLVISYVALAPFKNEHEISRSTLINKSM